MTCIAGSVIGVKLMYSDTEFYYCVGGLVFVLILGGLSFNMTAKNIISFRINNLKICNEKN